MQAALIPAWTFPLPTKSRKPRTCTASLAEQYGGRAFDGGRSAKRRGAAASIFRTRQTCPMNTTEQTNPAPSAVAERRRVRRARASRALLTAKYLGRCEWGLPVQRPGGCGHKLGARRFQVQSLAALLIVSGLGVIVYAGEEITRQIWRCGFCRRCRSTASKCNVTVSDGSEHRCTVRAMIFAGRLCRDFLTWKKKSKSGWLER